MWIPFWFLDILSEKQFHADLSDFFYMMIESFMVAIHIANQVDFLGLIQMLGFAFGLLKSDSWLALISQVQTGLEICVRFAPNIEVTNSIPIRWFNSIYSAKKIQRRIEIV